MLIQWIRKRLALFGRNSKAPLPPVAISPVPPRKDDTERQQAIKRLTELDHELSLIAANMRRSPKRLNDEPFH